MRVRYILCALFFLQLSLSCFCDEGSSDFPSHGINLSLEAEIAALRRENEQLRKEFSDVLLKNKRLEDERLKFELGVLSAVSDPGGKQVSDRELQMLKDILVLKSAVENLSRRVSRLSEEFRRLDEESAGGLPAIGKAKISLALEDLNEAGLKLRRLLERPVEKPNVGRCTVLDVDGKKSLLVLSAGSSDGAFCGLMLRSETDESLVAVVISVRPFASAACLVKGRIEKVAPGMIFVPGGGDIEKGSL